MTDLVYKDADSLAELYKTKSDSDIAKMCGVTRQLVGKWRKNFGIPTIRTSSIERRKERTNFTRPANRFPIDEHFFSEIDSEEKAYYLGFLAADGFVTKTGKWVSCQVVFYDAHILEDMRSAVCSTAPLRDVDKRGFPGSKPAKVLTLCSVKLVSDLATYGIIPGKSKTLPYASIPTDMEQHYIRGLFDGDGNVSRYQFSILGTQPLLDGLNSAIERHTGERLSACPCAGYPRLVGYRRNKAVINWIYGGSRTHLKRKYAKFLEFWQ